MQRIECTIERDSEIFLMGDTHEDIMLHEKGLQKHIDHIAEEPVHRKWAHVGDWIEAIATDDKRYQLVEVKNKDGSTKQHCPIPHKQAQVIADRYRKIAKQGIVGLLGNHERKHHRIINLAEYICAEQLGIPYGTGMCRVIFKDPSGKRLFNFLLLHGQWQFTSNAKDYEQQQANMKAMLRMRLNALRIADCALLACGHAHKLLISGPANPLYLNDNVKGMKAYYLQTDYTASYIPPEQRWCVCTGSYRKNMVDGIDDYAEGYGPVELGCVRVTIKDGKLTDVDAMKIK